MLFFVVSESWRFVSLTFFSGASESLRLTRISRHETGKELTVSLEHYSIPIYLKGDIDFVRGFQLPLSVARPRSRAVSSQKGRINPNHVGNVNMEEESTTSIRSSSSTRRSLLQAGERLAATRSEEARGFAFVEDLASVMPGSAYIQVVEARSRAFQLHLYMEIDAELYKKAPLHRHSCTPK